MANIGKFAFQTMVLPTKSMQEIVTSIATKITHLILSSSNQPEGAENSRFSFQKLVACSVDIVNALKNLVKISNETISVNYPHDDIITEEVDVASQNLLVAGENMHLCCQVLASTKGEIPKSHSGSCDLDLTSCICKTFQNLVVLLLCLDNAEVRHLITLSNRVQKELQNIASASSMEQLVEDFTEFSTAVDVFHSRTSRRCEDILSTSNHAKMSRALSTLTHSMPMLTTAFTLAIKYPKNDEALSAKIFAAQQIEKTLQEIIGAVKARPDDATAIEGQVGLLVTLLHSIDKAVDAENRGKLVSLEVESMVQSLVQQVMTLSAFTSKRFPRYSKKESHLVKECQKLLEMTSLVVRLSPAQQDSVLDSTDPNVTSHYDDSSEFGSVCRALRGKLKGLESCTFSLVTSLFCHIFTIKSEPLQNLVKVYENFRRNPKNDFETRLQSALAAFQVHSDDLVQISNIIKSCCSRPDVYRDFRPSISNFSSITKQIFTLCSLDSANTEHENEDKDLLSALLEEWTDTLQSLLRCCTLSLDLPQLTNEVETDISSDCEKCHEDIVNLDDTGLSNHVITCTGKAKLLVEVASNVLAASTDPLFRNNVLALTKQLKESIAHVIASSNLLIEDMAKLSSQEAFLAAISHLKAKMTELCCVLLQRPTPIDLTAEDRKGMRDVSDSSKISNMIEEMQKLNQKLANFGFEANVPAIHDEPEKSGLKVLKPSKSDSELIDDMFATSGPAVCIDKPVEEEHQQDIVRFGSGFHPLVLKLLDQCNDISLNADAIRISLSEILKVSEFLLEICEDSHPSISTCKDRILDMSDEPIYASEQDAHRASCSMAEVVDFWKKNLSESCNLIQGMDLKDECVDLDVLKAFCETWSKSYRILLDCFISVLRVHLISVRRFLAISDLSDHQTISFADTESDGSTRNIFSSIPDGSLLEMERMAVALSLLLCDVIVLYKRDMNKHSSEKKSSLITRLDVLHARCKQVSTDIRHLKKVIKEVSTDKSPMLDSCSISWLHLHSLRCSAKLCSLFSLIDTTLQLVLGVWKVNIPAIPELIGDPERDFVKDYKSKLRTLSQTAQNKIEKALANCSMEPQTVIKLTKMRNRVDVTCDTIGDVINFISKQICAEEVFTQHAHLLYHVMFLHQRFSLDVARTFLFTKALLSIANADAKPAEQEQNFEALISNEKTDAKLVTESSQPRSYAERLARLSKQRRDREKELLHLLSDIDAGKSSSKFKEDDNGARSGLKINEVS